MNKYDMYEAAVQAPDADVKFFKKTFEKMRGRLPYSLREDFCGTFALSRAWVGQHEKNTVVACDLDPEPIAYGRARLYEEHEPSTQRRIVVKRANVLEPSSDRSDLVVGLNFSYFIFRERAELKAYFKQCYKRLVKDGLFFLDHIGGPTCLDPNIMHRKYDAFQYTWELEDFDPIHNRAHFAIHFKRKGSKRRLSRAFTYDWRMWTIPEIRELMAEVGFKKSQVYWEGCTRNGNGNGIFKPADVGEACETWIAYIIGVK